MVWEFVHDAIVENNGGTVGVGVNPCQGGVGAFVVEFNIASIDFCVAFEVIAVARGAAGCPQTREADREWER